MSTIEALVTVGLWAVAYLAPTAIAYHRHHHQTLAIGALNVLLGWTVIGWIAAFIWACTYTPDVEVDDNEEEAQAPTRRRSNRGRA
jgi:hypothetical protein